MEPIVWYIYRLPAGYRVFGFYSLCAAHCFSLSYFSTWHIRLLFRRHQALLAVQTRGGTSILLTFFPISPMFPTALSSLPLV